MPHQRHARHALPLVLMALLVHLAGFVTPSLEHLLDAAAPPSACGCGEDCSCGCRCCGEEGAAPAVPSCCRAPATASDGPVWSAACGCGGDSAGEHLLYQAFRPALLAAGDEPVPTVARTAPRHLGAAAIVSRPHLPDDPVPRARS